jgi:hypothetical protein
VMAPASTPHASSFPAATHSLQLTPLTSSNSLYDFYRHSGAGWEILASNYTGSSGDVYSVNSKMRIPFPFNYNNSVLDTFQKLGAARMGTQLLTMGGARSRPLGVHSTMSSVSSINGSAEKSGMSGLRLRPCSTQLPGTRMGEEPSTFLDAILLRGIGVAPMRKLLSRFFLTRLTVWPSFAPRSWLAPTLYWRCGMRLDEPC